MYAGCCYAHKMHIVVMRLHIVYVDVEAGVLHIFAHHVAFICFYNNLQTLSNLCVFNETGLKIIVYL